MIDLCEGSVFTLRSGDVTVPRPALRIVERLQAGFADDRGGSYGSAGASVTMLPVRSAGAMRVVVGSSALNAVGVISVLRPWAMFGDEPDGEQFEAELLDAGDHCAHRRPCTAHGGDSHAAVSSQSMNAARNVGLAAPLNDTSYIRSAIGRAPEPVVVLRG